MKKRTSTKRPVRRPRRRRIAAPEEQQITQMMRKAGAYAFSDRLGYFLRLEFSADDAEKAVKTFYR